MNLLQFQLILYIPALHQVNSFTNEGYYCSTNKAKPMIHVQLRMIGGGGHGWRNDDFLSSLGGNEEDRDQSSKDYDAYKASRDSFEKRQMERMKSPEFQKFQQQMLDHRQNRKDDDASDDGFFDDMGMIQGADESRFQNMMRQAQRNMNIRSNPTRGHDRFGFEQILGVPLDDIDDLEQVD